MSIDELDDVRPGDPIIAEQATVVKRLLNRKVTGPGVIETATGWHIRPLPGGRGTPAKLVRVSAVLEDRLTCQEVRLTDWRTWENVGDTFDAAAWPTQELSDYENASNIVMVAFKFSGYWVVEMTGDRPYVEYPQAFCDSCDG